MSKLFDMLKNAARARGGRSGPPVPSALLSLALRRAANEREHARAVPANGAAAGMDVEPAGIEANVDAEADPSLHEGLAAAARERAEAEARAAEELRLREEAENALRVAAEERARAEREAADEARRIETERLLAKAQAEADELALEVARLRVEAEEHATALAREREEIERNAMNESQVRAEREAFVLSLEEMAHRKTIEESAGTPEAPQRDPEVRRLRRGLAAAIAALVAVTCVIFARAFMPGGAFADHESAPVFKLDRELRTAPTPPEE